MRFLSADVIYPSYGNPLREHVLIVHHDGRIDGIVAKADIDPLKIEHFDGALCPGFVNAHCHLELSHLLGKFPMKTGLPAFLMEVTRQRETAMEDIISAMQEADSSMWQNGIVAVGDISNAPHSLDIKADSRIYYHTFVELLALDPQKATTAIEHGNAIVALAKERNLSASLAPHAPYTISTLLVEGITRACRDLGMPTSIHMLESNDENEFYVQATGGYRKLYRELGIPITHFEPTGKTSLESILPFMDKDVKTLLVHNTIATVWDADWAENLHANLFWCFCPNANLFIEDRLPDIPELIQHIKHIAIGTDSLASNHGLSILDELKTIAHTFPSLTTEELLQWATDGGAQFLGLSDRFGSLKPGLSPGILHLITSEIQPETLVNRLF